MCFVNLSSVELDFVELLFDKMLPGNDTSDHLASWKLQAKNFDSN